MRNSKFFILLAVILIIALSFAFSRRGKQPFKDLTAEDISSAAVTLSPPDKTIQISDLEKFVSYLNDKMCIRDSDGPGEEYSPGLFDMVCLRFCFQFQPLDDIFDNTLIPDKINTKTFLSRVL